MSEDHPHKDLFPGFALGILEPEEARRVEEHLAGCAACRDDLAAFDEVTGHLSLSLPSADPPPGLEDRIMRRVNGASRVRRIVLRIPTWGAIAALLIVALGAGNVFQLARAGRPQTVAQAPGLNSIVLVGVDSGKGAYGTVVLDSQDNGGVLAIRGLPHLDQAYQYQLWLVRDGERRSGGVFSVNDEGYGNLLLAIPNDFKGFTTIGISVEPAGGSPAPTGARVARGTV